MSLGLARPSSSISNATHKPWKSPQGRLESLQPESFQPFPTVTPSASTDCLLLLLLLLSTSPTYKRLSLTGLPPRRLAGLLHNSGAQEPCFNVGRRLLQQFKVTENNQKPSTWRDAAGHLSTSIGLWRTTRTWLLLIRSDIYKILLGGGGISYYIRLRSTQSADWLKSSSVRCGYFNREF